MTVSICTPWMNHPELGQDYFDAIAIGGIEAQVVVADNASNPPLTEIFHHLVDAQVVRSEKNLGFAGGSNLALQHATGDFVLFLNNDIRAVREGWLRDLVQAAEPGVLVGAKLRTDDHAAVDGMSMPYLDGWCLGGMREDFLELGGWDDTLEEPSYYSDNLLCLEARAAGFVLREVQTGLIHKAGQTSQANGYLLPSTIANRAVYEERVRELVEV